MSERELDLHWITPQLALGGALPSEAIPRLARELEIGAVVDLREESCDDVELLCAHGVDFLRLPTPDTRACTAESLSRGVSFVREQLALGRRVHVHCQHGIGRSALLVLCVLVAEGHAPVKALELAKARRWKVSPSPHQLEAFIAFVSDWKERTGAGWPVPTFDELAFVAYAHLRQQQG